MPMLVRAANVEVRITASALHRFHTREVVTAAMWDSPCLVLMFKMAGDSNAKVRSAASIKLDGQGGLVVCSKSDGVRETFRLDQIQTLDLQYLRPLVTVA